MTKSDDPAGFGADTSGTTPEGHAGYQDPRYATPGTAAQPTDPRFAQGAQYQGQAAAQTSQPATYPGAGATAAPSPAAGYPAAAQPAAPGAEAGYYAAPPTADYHADNSAGYAAPTGYPAAGSGAGQPYAAAPSQPADYSQYHQPAAQPPSLPEYSPATQYASASAPSSAPEQPARTFAGASDPSTAYGHSGSETGYSGSQTGQEAYRADPPAASSDYGYAGAAASEPRASMSGLDAGYSNPAAQEPYRKDYDSPFDTYSSAAAGSPDQSGYQEPAHEGYFDNASQPDAEFYDGDYGDEDYPIEAPRRKRTLLVGGALAMALVVGGGLAYAYKNDYLGFEAVSQFAGSPPLIQADTKPAKTKAAESSSKMASNGGKLIYDRLQDPAEAAKAAPKERVVARQESVLDAASLGAKSKSDKPAGEGGASPMAGMEKAMPSNMKPDGSSKLMKPKSAAAMAASPRKVRTLVVKPDGTVMKPPAPVSVAAAKTVPESINTASINRSAAGTNAAASLPATGQLSSSVARAPTGSAELPKPKPKPQKVAALAAPLPAASTTATATSSLFAVQIAARRTQTDALATFANLQQKYPSLIAPYQPLIKKADLGNKGIWYRLRIGPMNDKPSASKLCSKLKTAGLKSCLVRPL